MFSGKWEMVIVFSLMAGAGITLPLGVLLQTLTGKPLTDDSRAQPRSAFPTIVAWLLMWSKRALKALFKGIIFLIIAFVIGFAIVLVCTGGMPLDPRVSLGSFYSPPVSNPHSPLFPMDPSREG